MAEQLVVLDGSTFFVSERSGDLEAAEAAGAVGFFHADVRHLSRWQLLVNGRPLRVLTATTPTYYAASVFATLASDRFGENPPISVRRDRIVADGVHEDLVVENHSGQPRTVRLEFRFAADFADLFQIKDSSPKRGRTWLDLAPTR